MALLDMARQYIGQQQVAQISQQLGIDPSVAQTAVNAALPMIVGGMARHASQPEGAAAIQQAASTHADAPNNLSSAFRSPPADVGGGGLLGHIFGQHSDQVQQNVQQASGLDPEKAKKLLMMLSPIVLGVLAHREFGGQKATQADPGQLAGHLQEEARTAQQESPHVGGLLGKLMGAVESQ